MCGASVATVADAAKEKQSIIDINCTHKCSKMLQLVALCIPYNTNIRMLWFICFGGAYWWCCTRSVPHRRVFDVPSRHTAVRWLWNVNRCAPHPFPHSTAHIFAYYDIMFEYVCVTFDCKVNIHMSTHDSERHSRTRTQTERYPSFPTIDVVVIDRRSRRNANESVWIPFERLFAWTTFQSTWPLEEMADYSVIGCTNVFHSN